MIRVTNNKERHVIIYSDDPESDKLTVKVLQSHFSNLLVIHDQFELLAQMDEQTPKVIFISSKTFESGLNAYYEILEQNPSEKFCEHKLVSLCTRHDEEKAYNACIADAIDDYIVSKPLYEMHRPILVARHLLSELGIHYIQENMYQSGLTKLELADELSKLVSSGIERKHEIKRQLQESIQTIEKIVDKAKMELISSNQTSLDVKELKQLLASIRSDEIRPELLRVQDKVLTLLDGLIKPAEQIAKNAKLGVNPTHARSAGSTVPAGGGSKSSLPETGSPKEPIVNLNSNREFVAPNRLFGADNVEELLKEATRKRVKISVLLIEKDNISLNLTSRLFDPKRFVVYVASSGRTVLDILNEKKVDLIFSDVAVPDCDCINLADQLNKKTDRKPSFVILTSNKSKDNLRRAAVAGVRMYLLKPLNKPTLDKVLEKCGLTETSAQAS